MGYICGALAKFETLQLSNSLNVVPKRVKVASSMLFWVSAAGTTEVIERCSVLSGVRYCWSFLKYTSQLIWLCAPPFFSAVVGYLILSKAPQAHDLFLEMRPSPKDRTIYWVLFYCSLLFFWVLPVFFGARFLIRVHDTNDFARTQVGQFLRLSLPFTLAAICLLGVYLAQHEAYSNLVTIREYEQSIQPDTDLGLLLQTTLLLGILFAAYVLWSAGAGKVGREFFFTAVIFLAFVLIIEWSCKEGSEVSECVVKAFPGLGAIAGLATLAACLWIGRSFDQRGLKLMPVVVSISLLLTSALFILPPVQVAEWISRALLFPIAVGAWVPFFSYVTHLSRQVELPLVLVILGLCGLASVWNDPHRLTLLSKPQLSEARTEQSAPDSTEKSIKQPTLSEALRRWKKVNKCEGYQWQADRCRPIFVAAQGGASRAAFYTATVLGEIADRYKNANGVSQQEFFNRVFAISGVSGGSLGAAAFAAALPRSHPHTTAEQGNGALLSANDNASATPCRALKQNGPVDNEDLSLWHGTSKQKRVQTYHESWRDCLQVILSADFLSPIFLRLAFSDLFGLTSLFHIRDRAKILESAIERRFETITGRGTFAEPFMKLAPGMRDRVDSSDKISSDTDENLAVSNPEDQSGASIDEVREHAKPSSKAWQPLLLLNGTSAETGDRIITSHLAPWYCDKNASVKRVFKNAFDFHELINFGESPDVRLRKSIVEFGNIGSDINTCLAMTARLNGSINHDVTLSTAVSNSARFPIVSPHGNIYNVDDKLVDRIIDGGYFENFGLSTIRDLIESIETFEQTEIKPLILLVTNDPHIETLTCVSNPTKNDVGPRAAADPDPERWLSAYWTPLLGLFATRNGRGAHSAVATCEWVNSRKNILSFDNKWTGNIDDFFENGFKFRYAPKDPKAKGSVLKSLMWNPGVPEAIRATGRAPENENGVNLSGTFGHVRVFSGANLSGRTANSDSSDDKIDSLSMSWWLSKPIQYYLDRQVKRNLAPDKRNLKASPSFLTDCEWLERNPLDETQYMAREHNDDELCKVIKSEGKYAAAPLFDIWKQYYKMRN